jgi:hypothetical protein
MEMLKKQLGPLGEAAAERAEWTAVVRWLDGMPGNQRDPVASSRKRQSVIHYMNGRSAHSGIPSITGYPIEAEYLGFHRSRQSRIKKTALELLGLWRAAGEPWLAISIRHVSDYMQTAIRRANDKNVGP